MDHPNLVWAPESMIYTQVLSQTTSQHRQRHCWVNVQLCSSPRKVLLCPHRQTTKPLGSLVNENSPRVYLLQRQLRRPQTGLRLDGVLSLKGCTTRLMKAQQGSVPSVGTGAAPPHTCNRAHPPFQRCCQGMKPKAPELHRTTLLSSHAHTRANTALPSPKQANTHLEAPSSPKRP